MKPKTPLLFLLFGFILFPLSSFAQNFTYSFGGRSVNYTITDLTSGKCITTVGDQFVPANYISGKLSIPPVAIYTHDDKIIRLGVTKIGEHSFTLNYDLISVEIPESVTSIGAGAFSKCSNLINVTIPNSVTEINFGAFESTGLTSVIIPNSVKYISSCAFLDCRNMVDISIPNTVSYIGDHAFSGCKSLTSVMIPNAVNRISDNVFWGCSSLTSVTIPNSITSIGFESFSYCSNLTDINIPNSVQYINSCAFSKSGLTSVRIPNSVTKILSAAFIGCQNLTVVTLPASLTYLYNAIFDRCDNIKEVYYEAIDPIESTEKNIFTSYVYANATLYVPLEAIEKCRVTEPWCNFKTIKAYDLSDAEEIVSDMNSKSINTSLSKEYYNLNGIKVADSTDGLTPGIYIMRQGSKSSKITIK